jgi:hypothetical protein
VPNAAAELILDSSTMSVIDAHYTRITADAGGIPEVMLLGRFLCCQAIQAGLMGRFGVWSVGYTTVAYYYGCADLT